MDCLIVGGGLIGMLCARGLVREGATVCLVDKGAVGHEASWAGGGILSPLYPWRYDPAVTALARWSQRRYADLARQLLDETGVDPEWERSGLLVLDDDESAEALQWAGRNGAVVEHLSGDAALAREPAIASRGAGALWMPEVAQLRNPRLLQALRQSLLQSGVNVAEHTQVSRLVMEGDRAVGVETASGRMMADTIILAAGAWSGVLVPGLLRRIEPVQGQMIAFKVPPGLLSRIVLSEGHYVIPRRDGLVLAGSTMEYRGFDKMTTDEARRQLQAEAQKIIPALADYNVEYHWAGLRPGSPAGVPHIGEHPQIRGLFVNAGHFRNGVVTGLASAQLLIDLVIGRIPIVIPDPYAILE